jgi:tetratricopeptide (TPR) repeat protein
MSFANRAISLLFSIILLTLSGYAQAAAPDESVVTLRTNWAKAKFQTPGGQKLAALDQVINEADSLNKQYPDDARVMLWYATALSSYAQLKGGVGVLPRVKKARSLLEEALTKQPRVENGLGYGVIGAMYARVPGWPVAFGDKKKARKFLEAAVKIDPKGSDSNYYYGDFLADEGDSENARRHLEIAKNAPIRKGYEIQDKGRKTEIEASLAKLR